MPMPDSVTVVIAAYNAAEFITTAINSVLAQTRPVEEILVVDDASTDASVHVVEQLAETIPTLRLLRMQVNSGPSAARNKGLDQAAGDWIAILDADDAFEPARIETLMRHGTEADILTDDLSFFDHAAQQCHSTCLNRTDKTPFTITLPDFVRYNQGSGRDWGLLKPVFRRSFMNRHQLRYPVERRHAEDFDLIMESLLAGARFTCIPEPLYRYTMRHGEISRTKSSLSRTVLDYAGIAERARAWAADVRLASDPTLVGIFETRASKSDRRAEFESMIVALSERKPGRLLHLLASRPGFASVLLRHLLNHAASKLSRSRAP